MIQNNYSKEHSLKPGNERTETKKKKKEGKGKTLGKKRTTQGNCTDEYTSGWARFSRWKILTVLCAAAFLFWKLTLKGRHYGDECVEKVFHQILEPKDDIKKGFPVQLVCLV